MRLSNCGKTNVIIRLIEILNGIRLKISLYKISASTEILLFKGINQRN